MLLSFDNASYIPSKISDMLCALSTGGGYATRKLYTNDELESFAFSRPYVINGISNIGNRPDLLERAIHLKLPPMPQKNRKTEKELIRKFQEVLPSVTGHLYDCVSYALDNGGEVEEAKSIRMADAANWIISAEPMTGLAKGSFISALQHSQNDLMFERVVNHPITQGLMQLLSDVEVIECYMGELHTRLLACSERYDKNLPATAAHLSSAIDRLKPALAKVGIYCELLQKDRMGRKIRITIDKELHVLIPKNPMDIDGI